MTRDDFLTNAAARVHELINSQARSPMQIELKAAINSALEAWESAISMQKAIDYTGMCCKEPDPHEHLSKLTYEQVIDKILNDWCEEAPQEEEEEEVQGPSQGGWAIENLFAFFGGYVIERMHLMGYRLVSKRDGLHTDACTWRFYSINQDQAAEVALTALEILQNKTIDGMMQLGQAKIAQALAPIYLA